MGRTRFASTFRRRINRRLFLDRLEARETPAVLFSDSFNRADVVSNPFNLGAMDNALGGPTAPHNHDHFHVPVWGPGPIGVDLVSNALQGRGLDFTGIQFGAPGSSTSESIGQDLNIKVDLYVPKTATGYSTQGGIYFRSRTASAGDGIIGGTSAGYWVRLDSTGAIHIRPLNTSPGFEVWTARPASFDSTVFHTMEAAFSGNSLQVALDGKLMTFYSALEGGLATTVSIPATLNGTNSGAAGVSFAADSNRGLAGGERADNLVVSTYSTLTGLPVQNNFSSNFDYGDAPDTFFGVGVGNYNTTSYDNGPSHVVTSALLMGGMAGSEDTGAANATATGDTFDDGVTSVLSYFVGQTPTVSVNVVNTTGSAATLYGWIDYNANGLFDNATERASVNVPDGTIGAVNLVLPVVPGGSATSTFARFRLGNDAASANAQGVAGFGEVEDYAVAISGATTSVILSGGNLLIDDLNGANTNDNLTIKIVGANIRVSDSSATVGAGTGATQVNSTTVEVPLASVTGFIQFTSQAGNDSLTLDLSAGDFIPSGGLKYDAAASTTDRMVIAGGSQGSVIYAYTNNQDGSIAMSNFGTVNFTGLGIIINSGGATDVAFNLPVGPSSVTLGDDTSNVNTLSRLSATTIVQTDFANPTNSLTLNRGHAADTVTVNALPNFDRSLAIGGATAPFGPITFAGAVTLASGYNLAAFASGTMNFSSTSSDLTVQGTGAIALTTERNIALTGGSSLNSADGDISVSANQQLTPTAGNFVGIDINSASITVNGTGVLTLLGLGGDSSVGTQHGLQVRGGSVVSAGTTNAATIKGTGGASSGNSNYGVYVLATNSKITSKGAAYSVTGVGGGTGASGSNYGVHVAGGTIPASSLGVTVTGTGGGSSGAGNFGVQIVSVGSAISATGGKIVINGAGGGTGASNYGVQVSNDAVIAHTGAGDVEIIGQGSASATGNSNFGVYINSGTAKISTINGNISINGTGGGSGASGSNYGVYSNVSGTLSAGGVGVLTINGTGGGGSGTNNYGAVSASSSWSGNSGVSVTGTEGAGTAPFGIVLQNAGISAGVLANIAMIGDTQSIDATSTINAGSNTATLKQRTIGRAITIGATDSAGLNLGLTDAELDRVTAGTLIIGDTNAGTITVAADLSRLVPTKIEMVTAGALNLKAGVNSLGGDITFVTGLAITQTAGTVQGGVLTLQAASGQTATFASVGNLSPAVIVPAGVTCLVDGSFNAGGTVQVSGTLGGKGSVGSVSVLSGGQVAPGSSPGKLTTGNIVANASTTFTFELNGPASGTQYDQLAVVGTVDLVGATLAGSLSYTPALNQVFTIIDNDGSDSITSTFKDFPEGKVVAIGAGTFKISYVGGDGNDVTLSAIPPTVASVVFGDGTSQRSIVKQVVVNFSGPVSYTGADAFTLTRTGTGGSLGDVSLTVNPPAGPAGSVTLTFSGAFAESTGSLIDGFYDLTIDASKVNNATGSLDGDANGTGGDDYVVVGDSLNMFFRLFGDVNGDGFTDNVDFIAFRAANGSDSTMMNWNPAFDSDGNGFIDNVDFVAFRARIGMTP